MILMAWSSAISIARSVAIDRDHPGVILRYGGGNEFRFWLPRMISGRNPDLGVVLRGAPKDWRGRRVPALAAEVVSRGSVERDYETKREEYLAYGLLEYWIVDPLKRQVTVLTRAAIPGTRRSSATSRSSSAWSCPASRRRLPSCGLTSRKTTMTRPIPTRTATDRWIGSVTRSSAPAAP